MPSIRTVLMPCALALAALPVAAQAPSAAALVRPGLWEVTVGTATRRICLADGTSLVQHRHGAAACTQRDLGGDRYRATVLYSCPGAGWGRTVLHAGDSRSVRIETQGIAENAPFAYTAAARWIEDCTPPARR